MTDPDPRERRGSDNGFGLLERSVDYLLAALGPVSVEYLTRRTPCSRWNLDLLLRHVTESIETLSEGIRLGAVRLDEPGPKPPIGPTSRPTTGPPRMPSPRPTTGPTTTPTTGPPTKPTKGPTTTPGVMDPIAEVTRAAERLLRAHPASSSGTAPILIGDRALPIRLLALTGALEITTHGWDIAWSARVPCPIPAALAEDLLPVAAVLVRDSDRSGLFGYRVTPPPGATAGDRLIAFLGRDPVRIRQ
jgi:hypothetical protein